MAISHSNIFNKKSLKTYISKSNISLSDESKKLLGNWIKAIKIRNLEKTKEIEIQGRFLYDFFTKILGYQSRIDDPEHWNITQEQKTLTDSSRADGALGFFTTKKNDIRTIIELKDALTDLDSKQHRKDDNRTPVEQAFGYVPKSGKKCKWVIVSNFIEIRLYHQSTSAEYETFNVVDLINEEEFKKFYFLLHYKNLIDENKLSVIDDIYQRNVADKESITKIFYRDYKNVRVHLFNHLKSNNPDKSELLLIEKTQKILDRFIFVCFCEDSSLLPERIFRTIVDNAKRSLSFSENKIWNEVKGLFHAIDIGAPPHNINKFNGGLFAPDPNLDSLQIKDSIFEELANITNYDFESDLNVNILGHIFEQSISDIEALKASIDETQDQENKGKRKKEGIFYTPKFITQYIVENSIGLWLEERKKELNFKELQELTKKDFDSIDRVKKGKRKGQLKYNKKIESHFKFWNSYQKVLMNIKVLDPACGSGAFLNQAFDFLFKEGQEVNRQISILQGGQTSLFDLDKHILSNNLFGVDLNPESVEITKLSLWIKTANVSSELTALDDNIQCGNSLIDTEIIGSKSFIWKDRFNDILSDGGFDVIIGNPPYIRVQNLRHSEIDYFKTTYNIAHKRVDISILFIELANRLLKKNGINSFITSNQFLTTEYGRLARKFLLNKCSVKKIIDYGDLPVFPDALTYVSIFVLGNGKSNKFQYIKIPNIQTNPSNVCSDLTDAKELSDDSWVLGDKTSRTLFEKLNRFPKLNEDFGKCSYGIISGNDKILMFDKKAIKGLDIEEEVLLPIIRPQDCNRYCHATYSKVIIYPYNLNNGKTELIPLNEIQSKYPKLYNYLNSNKQLLMSRKDSRKTFEDSENWYSLTRFGQIDIFNKTKIVFPGETKRNKFGLDTNQSGYSGARVFSVTANDKKVQVEFLLGLLNSELIEFYLHSTAPLKQGGYYSYSAKFIDSIPVPRITLESQNSISFNVKELISDNDRLRKLVSNFEKTIKSYKPKKLPMNIKGYFNKESDDLIDLLVKQKANISAKDRLEIVELFDDTKTSFQSYSKNINRLENEINLEIYDLFKISDKEKSVITESLEK